MAPDQFPDCDFIRVARQDLHFHGVIAGLSAQKYYRLPLRVKSALEGTLMAEGIRSTSMSRLPFMPGRNLGSGF